MGFRQSVWVFLGFRGRETETDPPESVSGVEDPPLTTRVVKSADVRSVPIGFFGWVGSPNEFEQP